MDIELLSRMVKEIILDSDAVTLPGVGSFLSEIVPSTFSDRGYTINPPYRRLYFSPKEGTDTLLVDFYSRSNNIERDDATALVVSFLLGMKEELISKKVVVFPGLGRLRATRQNNFFFVADEDLDIYPYGFGLEPVSLKTHVETPEEVATAVAELSTIIEEPAPESVPEPTPEPEPAPEPIPEPEPQPKSEPEPIPEPIPQPEPAPEPEPEATPQPQPQKPKKGKLWIVPAVLLALVLIAMIAIAVIGRTRPELIDKYLYNSEELELLESWPN